MKFVLKIDFEKIDGDVAAELGRALRYWGGATKQLDLSTSQRQDIYDSTYIQPIGYWELRDDDGGEFTGHQHDLD